jgi:hypothetical protein
LSRDYQIIESPRAKHVRLKLSVVDSSLTVVIPRGYRRSLLPALVEERRPWIERMRRKLSAHRLHSGTADSDGRPDRIELCALGETWQVRYGTEQPAAEGERVLTIRGAVEDWPACRAALHRWLGRQARTHLPQVLRRQAEQHGFRVSRITIRRQRSRWGSCSQHGAISLNQKLLFLPPQLVEQVCLHELCHTVHLNHSPEFWSLLESLAPGAKQRDRELRAAWQHIPSWVDGKD